MSRGSILIGALLAVLVLGWFAVSRTEVSSSASAHEPVATSESFPCVDHGCCCQTLAQCASRCCCFHDEHADDDAHASDVSAFTVSAPIVARVSSPDDEPTTSCLVPPRCGGRTPAQSAVSASGASPVLSCIALAPIKRNAFTPRASSTVDLRPDSRRPAPRSPPPRAASRIV